MGIEIMNGKFFKDGKEIKPTFGEMEQIRALKEAERKANERKVHAKLIEKEITTYYACIEFVCPICKEKNSVDLFEDEPIQYDVRNSDVDEHEISCKHCDYEFTIEADKTKKSKMSICLSYDPPIEN
jgi:hypothetical protein